MLSDVINRLQIDVPPYTHEQQEEDGHQLRVLIAAKVLQQEVTRNLRVHSWLVPASPELTGLLLAKRQSEQSAGPLPQTARERAAQDLVALCRLVVQRPDTEELLESFVDSPSDCQGALAFACLLQMVGQVDNARFWWQFAAGAGSTTAAYGLFLDGLLLDRAEEAVHCYERLGGADFVRRHSDDPPAASFETAMPPHVDEHIHQVQDEDLGIIALPGPGLPATLADRRATT